MDLTGAQWFKSSFSGEGNKGNGCVEVAFLTDQRIALRDSKDHSRAPHIYEAPAWNAFLAAIRAGEFNPR